MLEKRIEQAEKRRGQADLVEELEQEYKLVSQEIKNFQAKKKLSAMEMLNYEMNGERVNDTPNKMNGERVNNTPNKRPCFYNIDTSTLNNN